VNGCVKGKREKKKEKGVFPFSFSGVGMDNGSGK